MKPIAGGLAVTIILGSVEVNFGADYSERGIGEAHS